MARLIHLNGPSGIGKSTVARRYADLHPGVLDLDADQVVMMIGGWRTAFWDTLPAARRLALAMAETHLRTGYDVVMPQLVTRLDQAEQFEEAARAAGGDYVEIMLTAPRPQAKARFAARGDHAATTRRRTRWPNWAARSCSTGSTTTSGCTSRSVHSAQCWTPNTWARTKPVRKSRKSLPAGQRQSVR